MPTRKEWKAVMLAALATTLEQDAFDNAAGYLYDRLDEWDELNQEIEERRFKSVAKELVAQLRARAKRNDPRMSLWSDAATVKR